MSLTQCKHTNCTNIKNGGWGYCKTHAMRFYRKQNLDRASRKDKRLAILENGIAKIPLGINAKDGYIITDKKFAYLDKYKWNLGKRGYATTGKENFHHLVIGKPPKNMVVDHINRNRLDCRLENLRIVSYQVNAQNISPQKNNTSGYKGVWFRKDTNKWVANIKVNYKKINLGCFIDKIDAAKAYNQAAIKYFGSNAVLNEVE